MQALHSEKPTLITSLDIAILCHIFPQQNKSPLTSQINVKNTHDKILWHSLPKFADNWQILFPWRVAILILQLQFAVLTVQICIDHYVQAFLGECCQIFWNGMECNSWITQARNLFPQSWSMTIDWKIRFTWWRIDLTQQVILFSYLRVVLYLPGIY